MKLRDSREWITPTHPLLMAVNISWVFCQPIRRIAGTSRHLFRVVSLSKLRSVRNLPGSPAVAHVSRSAMGWRVRGGRGCGPARDWRLRLGNMGTRTQLCPASAPPTRARTSPPVWRHKHTEIHLQYLWVSALGERFFKDLWTGVFKQLWDTSSQKRQKRKYLFNKKDVEASVLVKF